MKITKESRLGEIIQNYPETVSVFQKYNLGCFGCPSAGMETIDNAAQLHGVDADNLVKDLNDLVSKNEES